MGFLGLGVMTKINKHKFRKEKYRKVKKKKKISKGLIITLLLAGLMILSVFGIMFGGYDEGGDVKSYNDLKFYLTSKGWITDVNEKKILFDYFPGDLEDINVTPGIGYALKESKVVYLTFNPATKNVGELELLRFNLQQQLLNVHNIISINSIVAYNETYNQTIINCQNATSIVPVINIIETTNASDVKITMENSCIKLVTDSYSAKAIKDRFLYILLGVMK